MTPLYDHLDPETAQTFSLVLSAVGIGNRVVGSGQDYRIDVPEPAVDAAREAIRRYVAENAPSSGAAPRLLSTAVSPSGLVVALLLLTIHLAVTASAAPEDYVTTFGANARRIIGGEWYRCATALLLHADAAHLAGNMAGVALFGGAVCSITGSGVGWLMILTCGILGNLFNAVLHETGHLSVGASTAVFGAVGILCALQAVDAARNGRGWRRVIFIFGAGVALLAFLGTSARSDVGAHLFGCAAGVPLGLAYGLWVHAPISRRGQQVCTLLAVGLLVLAWLRGVMH